VSFLWQMKAGVSLSPSFDASAVATAAAAAAVVVEKEEATQVVVMVVVAAVGVARSLRVPFL
jgi:hypothetical protein